jgi:general nucleoside transport system ATP-binding protein
MPDAAVAARGITKRFGPVVANDRVDFDVRPGEVHALLGENGSGKTTLCKVLTGLYRPDDGDVLVDGTPASFGSPADAYEAGIFMVHQHFSLVNRMTAAENIVLGWATGTGMRFDRRAVQEQVAAAAESFDMEVDPAAPVWRLSLGERQRVEILKALYRGARTLILDEPTTVLTPQEAERLFESLRRMADAGNSVVFISHKLHEVLAVCDRVTVLRHGHTTGTVDLRTEQLEPKGLARMMVGRDIQLTRRERRSPEPSGEPALEVSGVTVENDYGRPVVKDLSLTVGAGEIVGLAGVAGNGQRELAEGICGVRPIAAGTVSVAGTPLNTGDARRAIQAGIAFVPEDRLGVGLAPGLSVADNIVLKSFRTRSMSKGPFLRRRQAVKRSQELLEQFNVKGTPEMLVRQLSGGNAQKVLLAREMSSGPRVLVVAAPTRGLDIAAMETVRSLLAEAAERGVGVLMISEDLDEILDLADRVAVMCGGRVTGIVPAAGADVDHIGMLMLGHEAAA